jgi:hypothetical protein
MTGSSHVNLGAGVVQPAFRDGLDCGQCQDDRVTIARPTDPGLQRENERSALVQRLDQYRAIAGIGLVDVPWRQASARLLPATDMTIAGIVKHLHDAISWRWRAPSPGAQRRVFCGDDVRVSATSGPPNRGALTREIQVTGSIRQFGAADQRGRPGARSTRLRSNACSSSWM